MFIPSNIWTDPLFGDIFDPSDYHTLETALIVMLVLIYLITLAPFVGITREILDPETRRKSLEKKPHIRFVHHICLSQLVFLPLVWLVLVASQQSSIPGSSPSYAFPIILFFKHILLLLTVILWMSSKCFLKPENSKEDSPDGKLSPGVLQWYLNFRTGRRRSSPPGVRGTVAKTGKLTLQMKTEKQRQQTQHKQSTISSEDRRGSTSSTGSSA